MQVCISYLFTCSFAEDLHHWRGEKAHPVCPPLGVVDVTFPPAVWVLLQDLSARNQENTSLQTALVSVYFTVPAIDTVIWTLWALIKTKKCYVFAKIQEL